METLVAKELNRRFGSGLEEPTSTWEAWYDPNAGSAYKFNEGSFVTSYEQRYFAGYDTPNFHERKKRGELLPTTPFTKFEATGFSQGSYNYDITNGNYYTVGNYSPRALWRLTDEHLKAYAPDPADCIGYVQEAAAKIYGQGHDTLTFLAELVELRSLFVNTAKTLLKLRIPKNWKSASNEWLSGRYGWRTLIFDIGQLNEAVKSLNDKRRTRFSDKTGTTYSTQQISEHETTYTHYITNYTIVDEVTVGIRGAVTADAWIPMFQFNPLVTAWELIPLSFVLDWFVSVGKSIAAMSFLTLQSNYTASWGYQIQMQRTFHEYIISGISPFVSGTRDQLGQSEATLSVRVPCSNIPITPHIKLRLNPLKILDLLGLVIQRL